MILLLLVALYAPAHSSFSCYEYVENDPEPKEKECTESTCKGPNFVATTGYSGMQQSCGKCTTAEEISSDCKDCNTDGCNIKKKLEDMKCSKYEWNTDDTDKWVKKMEVISGSETEVMESCKKFQGEDDVCRRPTGGEDDTLDTFCGDCQLDQSTICSIERQCFTVAEGETESKITDCDVGNGRCMGPNFVATTGYSSMQQSCGKCTTYAKISFDCKDCNTDGCNIMMEIEDMKCSEYEWNTDKWVKKIEVISGSETEVMETCKKFQGEDDVCKRPIGGVDGTLDSFCGDCTEGSSVCMNTPAVKDSGAKGVADTIATLIAALYVLA